MTKGQQAFFDAVASGALGTFHKRVIEPIEGLPYGKPGGLVRWIGGIRLAGCNSFSTTNFALTDEGRAKHEVADTTFAHEDQNMAREFMCQYGDCNSIVTQVTVTDKVLGERARFCCEEHAALFLLRRAWMIEGRRDGVTAERLLTKASLELRN